MAEWARLSMEYLVLRDVGKLCELLDSRTYEFMESHIDIIIESSFISIHDMMMIGEGFSVSSISFTDHWSMDYSHLRKKKGWRLRLRNGAFNEL